MMLFKNLYPQCIYTEENFLYININIEKNIHKC